jgi:hypothetical protein
VVLQDLDTPTPDERLLIERLSEEHATVRVTGTTARSRPAIW